MFGVTGPSPEDPAVTCYSAGMPDPHPIVVMGRVFILLVPIAIIIGIIIFVIKRKKKKDGPKEEKIDDKQN